MKVLSLFDGMACGYIAFTELGIDVEKYIAYEIDKYAIQAAQYNFTNIEEKGDVFNANFTKYAGYDWLIGGSPCTYWSIAQTKNRETEAKGLGWNLFNQYIRALKEVKPKYFLYENNKSMSKNIQKCISESFGFEPIYINSALVSAQNRKRLYWVGKRNNDDSYNKIDIKQPEDKGILLKDILETNVDTRYIMNKPFIIISNTNCGVVALLEIKGQDIIKRVYGVNGKSPTLTTCGGGHREPKILINNIVRKMTVTECKRLQTIPEWYKFPISNTQAYKCLGNGWTVEVIKHLISSTLNNMEKN